MVAYEIPLGSRPRRMTIALGKTTYALRFTFANTIEGGWLMDIATVGGMPLACGIPLVTGADLLAQFGYLGIGGKLFVVTDGDPGAVPTYANLGTGAHLLFEPS